MGTVRYTVIDGEVIAEKRNGVRSLYVPDPLGSTVALLDNTQTKSDTFSYWPYGENDARTGTTATPFQFVGTAGYFRDSGSRTYVRERSLSPVTGRWVTKDPLDYRARGWSGHSYCGANPTSRTDPSGLDWTLSLLDPGFGAKCVASLANYAYGRCCGINKKARCQKDPITHRLTRVPITTGEDCVDDACCRHDCCVQFDFVGNSDCHCRLVREMEICLASGGCRTSMNGQARCEANGRRILEVFKAICLGFIVGGGIRGILGDHDIEATGRQRDEVRRRGAM